MEKIEEMDNNPRSRWTGKAEDTDLLRMPTGDEESQKLFLQSLRKVAKNTR